jgi:hypothetical protein
MLIVGFFAALGALFFFAWLSSEVLRGRTLQFDTLIRNAIHGVASVRLTRVMLGVTQLGSLWVLVPMGMLFVTTLLTVGRHRAALFFAIAALGATILNEVMKLFFSAGARMHSSDITSRERTVSRAAIPSNPHVSTA